MPTQNASLSYQKSGQETLPDPLIEGLQLSLQHFKPLLICAVFPALVEIAKEYTIYSFSLSAGQVFLITAASIAGTAWASTCALMLGIESRQGKKPKLGNIMIRALQFLPKIFMSYIGIFFLLFLSLKAIPLLVFVLFFLWAPAFCVGELYASSKQKPIQKTREEDSDGLDFLQEALLKSYFRNLAPWDFGFLRSMTISGKSLGIIVQLVILFWFAEVVPGALIYFFMGHKLSLPAHLLQAIITTVFEVLVLGLWANTFLALLPEEARQEIGLKSVSETKRPQWIQKLEKLSPLKKRVPVLILIFLNAGATWYLYELLQSQQVLSPSVEATVEGYEFTVDELIVTLQLTDPHNGLRWLDPSRFTMHVRSTNAEELSLTSEKSPDQDKATDEKDLSLKVKRAYVAGEDAKAIRFIGLSPYYKPLKVVLYFDRRQLKKLSSDEEGFLYYQSYSKGEEPVPLDKNIRLH